MHKGKTRLHVIVEGRVQGVFFRAETQHAATRMGVTGWVRNLPDGTVEAVFEGDTKAVEQAVAWCDHGSPAAQVKNVKVEQQTYTGEFDAFSIRY